MSCHLKTTGRVQGVSDLRTFFFPHLSKEEEEKEIDADDGWGDSDWGWEATENKENVTTDALNSWILDVQVGASSAGDHVAFGFDDKLAILQSKYFNQQHHQQQHHQQQHPPNIGLESDENCASFVTLFKDVIVSAPVSRDGAPPPPKERISCLTCLPIASQKRTSLRGAPDWTAILVGFTSGAIKFFTENGVFLLAQVFHEGECVERFKCLTSGTQGTMQEELTIQYSNGIIVSIEGLGLVQTLRACRNQAARASAAGGGAAAANAFSSPSGAGFPAPPPVAYRKWSLKGHDSVVDHVGVGMGTTCAFDQLQTASAFLGTRPFRLSPSTTFGYVATGAGPFVAFCYAREGATHSLMTDVSTFVSNKLTSMLSGASSWFGLGGGKSESDSKPEAPAPKIEPATPLNITHALPDMRRHGESVVLAPSTAGAVVDVGHGRYLAATTDSFGRVILVDVARKVAIRMWKGYRDAQLGFLQVPEDESSRRESPLNPASATPRVATFLVIYAPRRGILEVWTMEQGPRVGAFNVNKWCRLLYPGHEMLGAYGKDASSSSSSRARRQRLESLSSSHRNRLQFIDPDGAVKTIHVPFHLALTSKNSRRAEDLHLLKTFKSMMKDHRPPPDYLSSAYPPSSSPLDKEISRVLTSLKSHSIRQQALERLLQTPFLSHDAMLRHCEAVRNLLAAFSPDTAADADAAAATPLPATSAPLPASALDADGRILLRFCQLKMQLLEIYAELHKRHRDSNISNNKQAALPALTSHDSSGPESSLGLSAAERSLLSGLLRLSARTLTSGFDSTNARTPISSAVHFEVDRDRLISAIAKDESATPSDSSSSISLCKPPRLVSVCGFLASFEISRNIQSNDANEDVIESSSSSTLSAPTKISVRLSTDKNEPRFHKIAALFFAPEFDSSASPSSSFIEDLLLSCGIDAEFLLDLLLHAWIKTASVVAPETVALAKFAKLITVVTRLYEGGTARYGSDDGVSSSDTLEEVVNSTPEAEIPSGPGLSPWWTRMRDACANASWRFLPAALVAAVVGRSVAETLAKETKERKAEELGEDSSLAEGRVREDDEWIDVDEEKAAWTLLINRLQDCLAIAVMFSFKASAPIKSALRKTDDETPDASSSASEDVVDGLSVNGLLKAGRGGIPELVARWVARREVTVDQLLVDADAQRLDGKSRRTSTRVAASFDDVAAEANAGVHVEELETVSSVADALEKLVRKRIVHGLRWDVLAANCCWENAVLWNKFVEGHLPASLEGPHSHLQRALAFLYTIEDASLAHGVAALLWQTFLAKKMEALATTMEKVKKAPKDRLCRQALGPELNAKAVETLFPLAKELLEYLLETNVESTFSLKRETDPAWNTSEGHAPLVELAIHRKPCYAPNVAHHLLLLSLMEAFFLFQLKSVKILSDLFDSEGRDAFFSELHTNPVVLKSLKASPSSKNDCGGRRGKGVVTKVEIKTVEARERLLCRVLTTAVEHLHWLRRGASPTGAAEGVPSTDGGVSSSSSSNVTTTPTFDVPAMGDSILDSSVSASTVRDWIGRILGFSASGVGGGCHHLALDLSVDVDALRRHLCCEFYSHAMEAEGEETLLIVSDKRQMGQLLLTIAGQRIAHHLLSGEDSKLAAKQSDKLSFLPPHVAKWIKSLDWSVLRQPEVAVTSTAVLLAHVVDYLDEEDAAFQMAVQLVDGAQQLVD